MARFQLEELVRAAGAEIVGGALPQGVEAVGTDSRSLPPGALFVALRGERFDGHEFAAAAVQAGAKAVLVNRRGAETLGDVGAVRLVVDDTLCALGDMARWYRQHTNQRPNQVPNSQANPQAHRPVAAVTGSNGKTTTKELLAAALSPRGLVHKTQGNLNNFIGMPLTVLAWPTEAWAAVLEMGMNVPGEIARLTEIADPDVGVVTSVAAAHLQGLGSVRAVAAAKGELYSGLRAGATAVVNGDDALIREVCLPLCAGKKVLRFGTSDGCDVRVESSVPCDLQAKGTGSEPGRAGLSIRLSVIGEKVDVSLPLSGQHNALNTAAALAAAVSLGVKAQAAAAALANVSVPGGRLAVKRSLWNGVHFIDDTYNANPASMRAAFGALADLAKKSRRVAVLGDMFELGEGAPELHREVGEAAGRSGVAWLLSLGPNAEHTARGATQAGARGQNFASLEALLTALRAELHPGDWVLVKGSRGMRMERVLAELTSGAGGRDTRNTAPGSH